MMGEQLATELERRASNTDKVLDYFRTHPLRWIDAKVLMELGGMFAWRTRVSDARKVVLKEFGEIENRIYRIEGRIVSEYMYRPYVRLAPDAAIERSGQRTFDWNHG